VRYDDPARPTSVGADSAPLQVSGSPLPVVTLIRPMESEVRVTRCTDGAGDKELCAVYNGGEASERCLHCATVTEARWGWLACIHAHIEGLRFGYHTAWIGDLGEFHAAFLADPEAALARWFKYHGPESRKPVVGNVLADIWED
jgi:hypothetical protein